MEYLSDEELVYLYLNEERSAYLGQLYIRYQKSIYNKCLSFSKNPIEAQDMTHDVFLKIIAKLASYRGEAKFSTWIYIVTLNFCRQQAESKKKSQKLFLDCPWEQVDVALEDTTHNVAEMASLQLEWSMKQLSNFEQTLLRAKYGDKASLQTIAKSYNITVSSVKMRLMRARNKVRHLYFEQAQGASESMIEPVCS